MNEPGRAALMHRWLPGEFTGAGFAGLAQVLKTDPVARAEFVRAAPAQSQLAVSHEVDELPVPGRPLVFGPSERGDRGQPTANHRFPIGHLNGNLAEFALYAAALSAEEIRAMFEAGRPE